ncbi:SDR family oxidoreductase [Lewinella sp. IMCC34183]|uniref:SDR family oxidoreductase n=1 Tax=Lewinella sp. IMCC34183 TaxID=2248762 RepID=UPI000E273780|nr:SDR family oxidoreductase [Lewinella sp. IMCC34183]
MDTKLDGKVIVIAGGAGKLGSIGEVIVRTLAREGARPAIIDRSDRGHALVHELQDAGADACFVAADVTDEAQLTAAVATIVERYGRLDGLVNNVGVNDGIGLTGSLDDFLDSLRLNLASYWLLTKLCFPHLRERAGVVLNIGSKVGLTGQGGTSAYAAAKGGVLALTREWAVDFVPHGMRCNAIVIAECYTPAYQEWIETLDDGPEKLRAISDRIPLGNRMTTPQEIANTAVFLLSELSSHTTGQLVFVDGGYVHLDRALLTQA